MMLATHNSGTGEKSGNLVSSLFSIFSKCQNKTIKEQYDTGVRLFDIRVRKNKKGEWIFAHGLWESKEPAIYAINDLNLLSYQKQDKAYVMVTYEGICKNKDEFINEITNWGKQYSWVEFCEINVKMPKWTTLARYKKISFKQCFTVINGWKCLLPIPCLWKKLIKHEPAKKGVFSMYDFI